MSEQYTAYTIDLNGNITFERPVKTINIDEFWRIITSPWRYKWRGPQIEGRVHIDEKTLTKNAPTE